MSDSILRVVWFDDRPLLDSIDVEDAFRRAIRGIDERFDVDFKCIDTLSAAHARLLDLSNPIDLALVDVVWKPVGKKRELRNAEVGLLEEASARGDCATIMVSDFAGELLPYVYDRSRGPASPDSVSLKKDWGDARALRLAIEQAFGRACIPLRSRLCETAWQVSDSYVPRSLKLAAEEIACEIAPGTDRLSLRVVSGLSGATTILVNAIGGHPIDMVLKINVDDSELEAELLAHRTVLEALPPVFAPPVAARVFGFGVWRAIGFRVVPGLVAYRALDRALEPSTWNRVFDSSIFERMADVAEVRAVSTKELLFGRYGQLAAGRLERFRQEVRDLDLPTGAELVLVRPLDEILGIDTVLTALTVVHGDLHPRNVLVSETGAVRYVDAGSVLRWGFWCQDLARFSTWLACAQLDAGLGGGRDLMVALGLAPADEDDAAWARLLSCRVAESLTGFGSVWSSRGHVIDVDRDWRVAVCAELARAVYSRDWFSAATRRVVAESLGECLSPGWAQPETGPWA